MRSNKRRFLMLLSAGIIAWVVYCIISIASFNRHKTTPLRNIVNILPPSIRYLKVNDSSRIPVVIVEEHHEVIPYWYAAAEQSLITKSDVTILHIDGHDDNAYPIITEDFPLLKYPTTDIQLFSLMQRNDVFIVGASATGLIKRVIWVWPPWDKVNHKTDYKKHEAPVFLEALMRHLLKLTDLQLNITQTIGLCLTRSPNTLHFEPSMRFCVSYNDPNSTLVLFHTPSIQEIEKRTEKLLTLLSATVLPKFITVTRSVRDGYTPRHLAGKIETDIMQILNQKYHVLDHNLVHYDDSLLGGKKGWYNRYK
ncbi:hypothetical protein LOTGIDRAFT_229697 [Lottia gigantea]|uniref:Uncharacterized protein n=1 Tax=Lottia gigantea TaxID=225164 RepID=V3ZJ05_LOTGI|nr:hypothetical protein LOTGIDRAFT_229697 [Lottia gigantea]ESO84242.1 hypothetical protein LOTGIDRAFT_229697 [Lottia gigantea]